MESMEEIIKMSEALSEKLPEKKKAEVRFDIEENILAEFENLCRQNSLDISLAVERMMREYIKQYGFKEVVAPKNPRKPKALKEKTKAPKEKLETLERPEEDILLE